MRDRAGMRAADDDRQAVADQLRVAVDEGRLDLHEYDERLHRAYTAKTYGELDVLLADLPTGSAPVVASGAGTALPGELVATGAVDSTVLSTPGGRSVTRRWVVEVWGPWLRAVPIVIGIWAVTSLLAQNLLFFWPGWVAGPWGVVLAVRTVQGLATGEPARWAAGRERRRQRKREKQLRKEARRPAEPDGRELPGTSG
ncbi:DUF1707 domain-containing protein [Salinispora sp. H7-4]|uniref:DUF1707 SHOCT-like domain-containing protein n=1 Tax=Salinispora sp. H7-4 TaxID=2748321 RepID=UPI0015D27B49|nr:DUF1707 domain-containing protein [Salinispora sp. H7-4]NYT93080.1 DUF1707 domain-containing protein [Salinispora sp. H7-4]